MKTLAVVLVYLGQEFGKWGEQRAYPYSNLGARLPQRYSPRKTLPACSKVQVMLLI